MGVFENIFVLPIIRESERIFRRIMHDILYHVPNTFIAGWSWSSVIENTSLINLPEIKNSVLFLESAHPFKQHTTTQDTVDSSSTYFYLSLKPIVPGPCKFLTEIVATYSLANTMGCILDDTLDSVGF